MPLRQEAHFLRQRAKRLRDMASAHRTGLSDQLLILAYELEARADQLERAARDGQARPRDC
jgi:hypothetical protein